VSPRFPTHRRHQRQETIINYRAPFWEFAQPAQEAAAPCSEVTVLAALRRIEASRAFTRAHRCIALLAYLVRRSLGGAGAASENEIGIAVFRRDPARYYTGDDPIVRVQVGRLRVRLNAYYADEGRLDPVHITIPLGGYQPQVACGPAVPGAAAPARAARELAFVPLACLNLDQMTQAFTLGVNEELQFRLYHELGLPVLVKAAQAPAAPAPRYLLEGSLRRDACRTRASLRLRDAVQGALVWHGQVDSEGDMSIASQENLALSCLRAVEPLLR